MKAGKHVPEAMEKINWMLRDWRKDETTRMDPDLIDLMWEIHNELGSAEPIHIISGYRSKGTNEMLRRTVGGQASQSRHILGQAADMHFPDVPIKKLRYSALIRERGGVGYYPTSAIPFVHIDTDRVRAWPRLPRNELALLFPNGRTQHLPEDGDPISMDDVKRARAANTELAPQIAEYPPGAHASQERRCRSPRSRPSLPQLLAPPTPGRAAVGARHASERSWSAPSWPSLRPSRRVCCPSRSRSAARRRQRRGTTSWTGELRVAAADPGADSQGHAAAARSRAGQPGHALRAGACLRRGAPRGAVLPAVPDRAAADADGLGRRSGAGAHGASRSRQDAGVHRSGPVGLPMRLRVGPQTAEAMWAQQFKGEAVNFFSADRTRIAQAPRPASTTACVHTQAQ